MSRIYTASLIADDMVTTPEHFNLEAKQLVEQFDRSLDSHNMPTSAISGDKFKPRLYQTDGIFDISKGRFSDYYSGWGQDSLISAQYGVFLATSTTTKPGDWNRLDDIPEASLSITDAKEGIIHGHAVIDLMRRRGHATGPSAGARGDDIHWWTRVGVFLDGRIIADSGPTWPRRYTHCLKFSEVINAGPHEIDIRFQYISGDLPPIISTTAQGLYVYACGISCKVQYR